MGRRRRRGASWVPLTIVVLTAAQAPYGTDRGIDVLSYLLMIDLDRDAETVRATAEVTVRVTEAGLDSVRFDLVGLDVDSVRVGGARSDFARADGRLIVRFEGRRSTGDTVSVQVFYGGRPADGLIMGAGEGGAPTVFADNWPNRARYWFPSVDDPADKATVEYRITTPAEWSVVANGRMLRQEPLGGGRKLTVWATDRPIPVYTMVIGASVMSVREIGRLGCDVEDGRCVRVTRWADPKHETVTDRLFGRAPRMVAFYDSLIAPFPYEKLALVEATTRFGGMENASAIFFGTRGIATGRADERLVAHEIAHQWFGDSVTEADWHHLWLSEGFATYLAAVFFEFADGDSVGARLRRDDETAYMASPVVGRPVIDPTITDLLRLLNRNNYEKGGWVLHMLRSLLGDEAFFAGLRRYYERNRHGTALTDDFRHAMEEVSGRDLRWFFEQWLTRPGYPELEVRPVWSHEAGSLELSVRQVQTWPPFRFPLEVAVELDGAIETRTIEVDAAEVRMSWPLPAAPDRVIVDPDNRLLGPSRLVE